MNEIQKIENLWTQIYGNKGQDELNSFIKDLELFKKQNSVAPLDAEWYKDVTVYSLYVDLFNTDFQGLENKLDYIQNLGVSCLWLLPILDSPGRDAGFDISNYRAVRPELLGGKSQDEIFDGFLKTARAKGIKVIFDIAINHTSDQHPWFLEAKKSKDNPFRDYYIWNEDIKKYEDARIIFYGIEESNWKKEGDEYFFHRFFDFQPDLNFRNPKVLVEMSQNFLYWLNKGVDGFRADAIPYLWKEEGTECENHEMTHTIVKFFRAVIDFARPNTLLLAEACQKPKEVVKYFGDGDECHAGYHFPLMPQIFKALKSESNEPIIETLSLAVTPEIPEASQWFTFLRCHDELSLELVYVTEDDRKYIHDNYCKQQQWDFRKGEGIASRLAELMDNDVRKISLIYSVMLTLPGTPVVYYGDEFGKQNDVDFYNEQIKLTGKDDTRFLVRGRIDWDELENQLKNPESLSAQVYSLLSKMLKTRSENKAFGRGTLVWKSPDNVENANILMFEREYNGEKLLVIQNLSDSETVVSLKGYNAKMILSNNAIIKGDDLVLGAYAYFWARI